MNRDQLMKKIEALVDAAARGKMYGKIEIEFQAGAAVYIRKTEQEKIFQTPTGDNYRGSKA